MTAAHVAGVDLGTTSVKAGLYTVDGELISSQRWLLTTTHGDDGSATQDPAQWVDGVRRWLSQQPRLIGWSVGGQMNTYTLADERGRILTGAITWQDRRRAAALDADEPFTSAIGRALLFQEISAQAWNAARWMLLPKDALMLASAGAPRGDAQSWNGVLQEGKKLVVNGSARAIIGNRVPPLGSPGDIVESPYGPAALGCPDTIASVLGCGLEDAAAYSISGTSESIVVHSAMKTPSAGIRNSVPIDKGWLHVGPSSVGGVTLEWAAGLLSDGDVGRLVALAARVTPGRRTLLFAPYLAGERAPLWDPSLTGSWRGLRVSHTAADLAAAVLEGVSFSVRHAIDRAQLSAGQGIERIIGQGGILHNGTAAQLRADALERPLEIVTGADTTIRGAAAIAMSAATGESLQESTRRFAATPHTVEPRPNDYVSTRYEAWLELAAAG